MYDEILSPSVIILEEGRAYQLPGTGTSFVPVSMNHLERLMIIN